MPRERGRKRRRRGKRDFRGGGRMERAEKEGEEVERTRTPEDCNEMYDRRGSS